MSTPLNPIILLVIIDLFKHCKHLYKMVGQKTKTKSQKQFVHITYTDKS